MKMKTRTFILAAALGVCASMSATDITAVYTKKVDVGCDAHHPTLSPNGKVVLFTSEDYTGLKSLNLLTNEVSVIDETPKAGFNPRFTADGNEVVYRTAIKEDGISQNDVKRYSFASKAKTQLMKHSKDMVNTPSLVGDTYAYAFAKKQAMEISINGVKKEINPIEYGYRYLWPSVSPSATKLVFSEVYSGLFVSNVDGTQAKNLASRGDFPCWVGDKFVVALSTKDDGYVITSAKIIAIEVATGKVTTLTDDSVRVDGLTAIADKIVYTTEDGEMYIMNILINE